MLEPVIHFLTQNAWSIGLYVGLVVTVDLFRRGKLWVGSPAPIVGFLTLVLVIPTVSLAFYYASGLAVALTGSLIAWLLGTGVPHLYDRSWRNFLIALPIVAITALTLGTGDPAWLRLKLWMIGLVFGLAWTDFVGRLLLEERDDVRDSVFGAARAGRSGRIAFSAFGTAYILFSELVWFAFGIDVWIWLYVYWLMLAFALAIIIIPMMVEGDQL